MASYDPEQYVTTWAGIPIQGAMDGQFFDASFQEDAVMLHTGAQGFQTYVENPNKSGIVTITLSQRSPTNALLSAAVIARLAGPFLAKDLSDKITLVSGANARIGKHGDIKRGKEIIGVEWKIIIPKMTLNAGGDS